MTILHSSQPCETNTKIQNQRAWHHKRTPRKASQTRFSCRYARDHTPKRNLCVNRSTQATDPEEHARKTEEIVEEIPAWTSPGA
jgi:hypothetical protein